MRRKRMYYDSAETLCPNLMVDQKEEWVSSGLVDSHGVELFRQTRKPIGFINFEERKQKTNAFRS